MKFFYLLLFIISFLLLFISVSFAYDSSNLRKEFTKTYGTSKPSKSFAQYSSVKLNPLKDNRIESELNKFRNTRTPSFNSSCTFGNCMPGGTSNTKD